MRNNLDQDYDMGIDRDLEQIDQEISSEQSEVEVYNRQDRLGEQKFDDPIVEYADNREAVEAPTTNKKKKMVIYGIIALTLAGVGFVGYNKFFKPGQTVAVQAEVQPTEMETEENEPSPGVSDGFDNDIVKPVEHKETENLRESAFSDINEFESQLQNPVSETKPVEEFVGEPKTEIKIEPTVIQPEIPFDTSDFGSVTTVPVQDKPEPTAPVTTLEFNAPSFEPVQQKAINEKERQIEYLRLENERLQRQLEEYITGHNINMDSRVEDMNKVNDMLKDRLEESIRQVNEINHKYETEKAELEKLKSELATLKQSSFDKVVTQVENKVEEVKLAPTLTEGKIIKPREGSEGKGVKVIKPASEMVTSPDVIIKEKLVIVGEEKIVEPTAQKSDYKINSSGVAEKIEDGKIEAISNGVVWVKIKGEYKVYRQGDKIDSGRVIGFVDDNVGVFDNENILIWKK